MIRDSIEALVEGTSLTSEQAADAMTEIMTGDATPAQFGAFVTALRLKGETPDEIAGMAQVMRDKSLHVDIDGPLVDTCGTGGDSSGSFNISTTARFVVAGAGGCITVSFSTASRTNCSARRNEPIWHIYARSYSSPRKISARSTMKSPSKSTATRSTRSSLTIAWTTTRPNSCVGSAWNSD